MIIQETMEAVARGWCHSKNENKIVDVDLAEAISDEINELRRSDIEPKLGCATTGQLLAEIKARIEMDGKLGYRTIDS